MDNLNYSEKNFFSSLNKLISKESQHLNGMSVLEGLGWLSFSLKRLQEKLRLETKRALGADATDNRAPRGQAGLIMQRRRGRKNKTDNLEFRNKEEKKQLP